MKQVLEWDEDYVLNLPPGEHDWVEFKESRLLDFTLPDVNQNEVLNELSKQVSAFANSGGGTIVYGINDPPIGTPRTIDDFGGISLNLKNGAKEWLEDVIPNLVDFRLSSFNIYVITANSETSAIAANKGVFLIDIASSDAAPHQAKDKKYYARVGGKSQPIGHRLVMDIIGRAKYPSLTMHCSMIKKEEVTSDTGIVAIQFSCQNVGKIYANYVNGYVSIPSAILGSEEGIGVLIDGKEYRRIWFDNTVKDIVNWVEIGYSKQPTTIARYRPVLPKLGFIAIKEDLIWQIDLTEYIEYFVYWEIFADNAPSIEGKFKIADLILD